MNNFLIFGKKLCVKWGSTNTSWHINVHHEKNFILSVKFKHNGDCGMGHLWLIMGGAFMAYNGWGIYDLRVWLWLKWVGQL